MPSPLQGIKVLDLSSHIAGPYCCTLLGDMGASVIKVERLGGDPLRWHHGFHVWNRSKRSIALDLKRPDGLEIVRVLAKSADVLVESFRPGTTEKLGISDRELRRDNPRLIYCSIPGFGSEGSYSDLPGYDPLVAAIGGVFADQGGEGNPPVFVNLPVSSYAAALLGSIGIASALYDRSLRGVGQQIEVPLLNAAMVMQTANFVSGEGLARVSTGNPLGGIAVYRLYQCADDWLFLACGNQTFWHKLCLALDLTDLLGDPRFENAPWGPLPEDHLALSEILASIFRTKKRDEWLSLLTEHDVPCAPVRRSEEFLDDPQVLANEMSVDLIDPAVGPTKQLGVPAKLLSSPGVIQGPAPLLGQHTVEILRELGYADAGIASLVDAEVILQNQQCRPDRNPTVGSGWKPDLQVRGVGEERLEALKGSRKRNHALEGIKVIDLSSYIAGSFAPTLLAELGADVIKVESHSGDPFRTMLGSFEAWNRGKRGVIVDLKRPEGREIVYRMVREADVVVENYRRGNAEKIGVDYETLKRINPRIIYCAVAGHGEIGPYRDRAGFDPLLQARGGAMAAQGGIGHPPIYPRVAISDYAAAMVAAWGIAIALFEREQTGEGQRIETSLTNATMAIQAHRFIRYEGKPPNEPGGPDLRGFHAGCRLYATATDWICLYCPDELTWQRLGVVIGRPHLTADPRFSSPEMRKANDQQLVEILTETFLERPAADWLENLKQADVPSAPVLSFAKTLTNPHFAANELFVTHVYPSYGPWQQVGLTIKMDETPGKLWGPAPGLGEHTASVLADYGYTLREIEHLRSAGVIN